MNIHHQYFYPSFSIYQPYLFYHPHTLIRHGLFTVIFHTQTLLVSHPIKAYTILHNDKYSNNQSKSCSKRTNCRHIVLLVNAFTTHSVVGVHVVLLTLTHEAFVAFYQQSWTKIDLEYPFLPNNTYKRGSRDSCVF